jgi:hypothetical protein
MTEKAVILEKLSQLVKITNLESNRTDQEWSEKAECSRMIEESGTMTENSGVEL